MNLNSPIQYVRQDQIDTTKWDCCIDNAHNGFIYGYSYYLDAMSKNWDALIMNDYEAVMPLTWNKKFGIRYLYQPPFTQQLGIFSSEQLSGDTINIFLNHSKQHFQFGEIGLNFENKIDGGLARNNFILSLNKNYLAIESNYNSDLKKNLRRAQKKELVYTKSNNFELTIELFKGLYSKNLPSLKSESFELFKNVCQQVAERESLLLREVKDIENNLLSTAIFFQDKKRIYLILSATPPDGRAADAQHFLIDNLIREFENCPLLLDFEGSSIPSIAYFNQRFGAKNQSYYFVKWNNLPWPLKLFK